MDEENQISQPPAKCVTPNLIKFLVKLPCQWPTRCDCIGSECRARKLILSRMSLKSNFYFQNLRGRMIHKTTICWSARSTNHLMHSITHKVPPHNTTRYSNLLCRRPQWLEERNCHKCQWLIWQGGLRTISLSRKVRIRSQLWWTTVWSHSKTWRW